MPEIARLNLSGPVYDPMKGRDQESMSEKIRKNSQAVLSMALQSYQIKGEQHKLQQYEVMKRSDAFMAHYGKDFFNNKANPLDPKTWKFTDPEMRGNMLNQWKSQVGGNYKGFMAAYEMAKQNEMDAMAKSMIRGRAGYRTDKEYALDFAKSLDTMSDTQQQKLFENVSPELYTQMMTLYRKGGGGPQGQDDTEGLFGWDLINDFGDILVENFNVDRDEYDEFMEGRGFGEGAAKTFLPEHWRDAYRAASKQDWGEFSDDEKLKWTQIPAYLVEYYALKKGGKALWRKLSGYGKSTTPPPSGGGTKPPGGDKGATTKKTAEELKKQAGGGKKPVAGAKKTPEQLIKEYKGAQTPKGAKVNTNSKWYNAEAPKPKDYKTPKGWQQAFRNWKKANGYPVDPSKVIVAKANPKPKSKGGGKGGGPDKGAGTASTTGQKGGTPVAAESGATLKMPTSQMAAAEKEIATKLSTGQISAAESKLMSAKLKELAASGDEITDKALRRALEKSGKQGKSLLRRVGTGALKWAVVPMAATTAGVAAFGTVGEAIGGETAGQLAGVVGGSASGIASIGATDLLKRAYNKHGLSWIMKRIVSKAGPALAARTIGKGLVGGIGTILGSGSGPWTTAGAYALTALWLADDVGKIYNILQEAEANGEL